MKGYTKRRLLSFIIGLMMFLFLMGMQLVQ